MANQKYLVVGRMLAGWHADSGAQSSSGGTLEHYLEHAANGAGVYDGSECSHSDCVNIVINGPLLKVDLVGVKRFGKDQKETARRMLPGMAGAFGVIIANSLLESTELEYGSLDHVDWPIYRELLRKLPGMKLGTINKGIIQWDA